MTIEITLRSGNKAVLNRERMTFTEGGKTFPLPWWPITEHDGTEVCDNMAVVSWREIPDVKPDVPELPVLPSASVPNVGQSVSDAGTSNEVDNASRVPVPCPTQVPDSGTDWIK